ncbi:MAG: hypothetical protein H6Q20_1501 [Bacteroidetes bacterium]|jgi:hypothetical protein|nr:hypothetical protein [Bacteroidota bacterium]
MKKLNCPQCKINRFRVKNDRDEYVVVTVSADYEIFPLHPGVSLEGYNLDVLYCLGCSWKGSAKSLTTKH